MLVLLLLLFSCRVSGQEEEDSSFESLQNSDDEEEPEIFEPPSSSGSLNELDDLPSLFTATVVNEPFPAEAAALHDSLSRNVADVLTEMLKNGKNVIRNNAIREFTTTTTTTKGAKPFTQVPRKD